MNGLDWNAEAVRVANYVARHIVEMQRGALLWHHGIITAFGNDGYAVDARSQGVVELLRQIVDIPAWKVDQMGFGVNDGKNAGHTWVLLLDPALSHDVVGLVDSLDEAIWTAWNLANGHSATAGFDQHRRLVQEAILRRLKPPAGLTAK
jgi:hypothetical protein